MELRRVPSGPQREPHLPLLLLADDAEDHVRAHLGEGDLFVLDDAGEAVGAVQAVPRGHGTVELTLVAVAESRQGRGVGQVLLRLVLAELRAAGVRRVEVGTSNAGVGQIAFYQKAGFRLWRIERDYFDEARGYDGTESDNGIVHRDMVWMDLVWSDAVRPDRVGSGQPAIVLSADAQRVVREQSLGFVATVTPDGRPNVSPKGTTTVWDDGHLVFADLASPGSVANLRSNPAVEVDVVDPILRRGWRFTGVGEVHVDGPVFDEGVRRYEASGIDPQRIRSIVLIRVEAAAPLVSPAYDQDRTEEEVRARWVAHLRRLGRLDPVR